MANLALIAAGVTPVRGVAGRPDQAVMAVQWDESKHKRGQPGNKGEFGPGGGGTSSKQPVATPEGIARVKEKFPELFKDEAPQGAKGWKFGDKDLPAKEREHLIAEPVPEGISIRETRWKRESGGDFSSSVTIHDTNGKEVGRASLRKDSDDSDSLFIEFIMVNDSAKGKGFGKHLVNHIINSARSNGMTKLVGESDTEELRRILDKRLGKPKIDGPQDYLEKELGSVDVTHDLRAKAAESVMSQAIRAERLARRIEKVLASGSEAGHEFRGNQWTRQAVHPIEDPSGHPTGKIKRAVLIIGGKRYKGPSHFQALMEYYNSPGAKRHVDPEHQGFETASGHFLNREQAAKFIDSRQTWLVSQDPSLNLQAIDGKLYTQDRVLARDSDKSAKAVIKDEAGNVLLIKDSTYGTWDLPGGHLHEGESLDQGLQREVREETGLEILGESWRSSGNNGRSEVFDVAVAGVKPRVRLSTEHTAYKWVGAEKAEELVPFWLQGPAANALGSSRASFYPGNGKSPTPGNQSLLKQKLGVRDEAEIEVAKAVARIVTLAEAEVLAKKPDDDAFWTYAAATFFGAIMAAYGQTAQKLAVMERGADHGEAVTEAEERAHAEQRAELLKDFPRRVKERLEAEVKRGQELGETEAELHRRVGIEGDKILQGEGRVVAETEAQAISGAATLRALKRAGFSHCVWVSVGDDRVRETHIANEIQGEVKLGDKFSNGCRFPGDPLAPLAETINCRCVLIGGSRV